MDKDKDQYLSETFPLLYRERHGNARYTCMCWGFCVGDGWYDLILRLSQRLEPMIAAREQYCECGHPEHIGFCKEADFYDRGGRCDCLGYRKGSIRAAQVKQKFGGLRFYMDGKVTEEMRAHIHQAESESFRTCEDCGAEGQLRRESWICVLCDPCYVVYRKKREEEARAYANEMNFRGIFGDMYEDAHEDELALLPDLPDEEELAEFENPKVQACRQAVEAWKAAGEPVDMEEFIEESGFLK